MIKSRQINKNKRISQTEKYDKKNDKKHLVRRRLWKRGRNEDSEKRGEDEKRGKKMPFKSRRKNRRKKREDKKRGKNPKWNSLWSHDNKKKTQKKIL